MSLNRILVMGRLTADPELKRTQNGTPVVSFTLAVQRDFKDTKTGERQTDFLDVVAWKGVAELVCGFFHKGRLMIVEGRLQARTWTDKNAGNRKSMEIIAHNVYFCESSQSSRRGKENDTQQPQPDTYTGYNQGYPQTQTQSIPGYEEYDSGDWTHSGDIPGDEKLPF